MSISKEQASRMQSYYARQHGGQVEKGSYAARAQHAADTHGGKPMSSYEFSQIQSSYAKDHGGQVPKGSWPAQFQSQVDKRE